PAPHTQVERVLAQADSWQFDTWRLRDVTHGHPLSALGFYLIQRAGLITNLKLKPAVLARLLRHIEAGYNDNPYHNATHAADVLQTLHVIIHGAQLHVHYLDQLGLLAAYFAAIVHDYGHPGLTNDFLVATSDPLAVRYNDKSPLENHHAAAAFSCMRRTGLDVLAPLTTDQKSTFRKQVIEMVLATDMKQHFSLLSHFSTVHRLASYNKPAARLLSLQMVIKAADLGHLGEGFEVHKRWLSSLEEEFFRQGDKERQLGIPISPLFDRAKQGVSKSQVGFYDFVALPLLHALCSAFPGTQPLMTCFMDNYHHYTADSHALAESRSFKMQAQQTPRQAAVAVQPSGT
ncbi:3'5'-cyclic nucleotide phosphodiesterase, partial [Volvox carteri f. nagariensis]